MKEKISELLEAVINGDKAAANAAFHDYAVTSVAKLFEKKDEDEDEDDVECDKDDPSCDVKSKASKSKDEDEDEDDEDDEDEDDEDDKGDKPAFKIKKLKDELDDEDDEDDGLKKTKPTNEGFITSFIFQQLMAKGKGKTYDQWYKTLASDDKKIIDGFPESNMREVFNDINNQSGSKSANESKSISEMFYFNNGKAGDSSDSMHASITKTAIKGLSYDQWYNSLNSKQQAYVDKHPELYSKKEFKSHQNWMNSPSGKDHPLTKMQSGK
jgi:hypothetical protein